MHFIGIDLGTTNSSLASASADDDMLSVLEIPQLSAPGLLTKANVLPSFMYLPHEGELSESEARLPWDQQDGSEAIVGIYARDRGALAPDRLISSAKSWLCNRYIDRHAALLPWRSEISQKRSAIDASVGYLQHLLKAFAKAQGIDQDSIGRDASQVVVAVPASFDEVARNLTLEAARLAGLTDLALLEEPQAVFYAWIATMGKSWRDHVKPGDLVLVCDVGGGTTDFSLIAVAEEDEKLLLERVSVGDHLLLGGDNMDLALAHALRSELQAQSKTLDHWQFLSLVNATRAAKERLLEDPTLMAVPLSIASRGASLFASTISCQLTRTMAEQILFDGFFPVVTADVKLNVRRSVGIQEYGLNYETDAAITRHLAHFLRRSRQNVESKQQLAAVVDSRLQSDSPLLMPNVVMFNGGVFNAPQLRRRVLEVLSEWSHDEPVRELVGAGRDVAVAKGAAYYAKLRATGKGIRVKSGTARSYYVGVDSLSPAVPGVEVPVKGLCVVPQGTDEGTEVALSAQQFGVVVGEPVEFRFFSSAIRAGDTVGTLIDDAKSNLEESARLNLTLDPSDQDEGRVIPVHLGAQITALGTLEVSMREHGSSRKWNLEFDLRSHENL